MSTATVPARNGSMPTGYLGKARAALRADPRQAILEDVILCLICGRALRQLTNTHLRAHGIATSEYKERFGYNRGRPLMCVALQRLYAARAVKSRLADLIRSRPILVMPELRRRGGARRIALEEFLTRREAR
jgi:ROS/MUCR transcriptional regulator protein